MIDKAKIFQLRRKGNSYQSIANLLKISKSWAFSICSPRVYSKKICESCGGFYKKSGKRFCSKQCFYKWEKGNINIESNNGQWKGKKVSYTALHEWIGTHLFKPKLCNCCGSNPPYDLANISGEYKRDVNDYKWLCRRCHMLSDGRINNLKQFKSKVL